MRNSHTLNTLIILRTEAVDVSESCYLYRLLAFILPFMAMTFTGLVCQNYSAFVASTVGVLAGVTSFGLYSMIKFTLKSMRTQKPVLASIPLQTSVRKTLLDG